MASPTDDGQRAGQRRDSTSRPVTVDDVLGPAGHRDLKQLPRLVARAFALVWDAAPRQLLLSGGLQAAAGLSLAVQLLVVRRVIDRMVAAGEPPPVAAIAPELAAFGLLLVVVALAGLARNEQQRVLGELVEKHATGKVMDVATSVGLIEFDNPAFYDRLQRARVSARARPLQIANGVLGLLSGGVAVVAVGGVLLWLEPIVAGLIALGVVPAVYTNRLSSRLLHAHAVRHTPGDRRRDYLYGVLSRKDEAQEVRAFDAGAYLRGEHDRLYDERIADLRHVVRRRLLYGLASSTVAAVVTIGSLALLLAFVRAGRLDVGAAAAAIGAVVLVAGRLRGLIGASGSLYEGALFLQDFTDFVALQRRHDGRVTRSQPGPPGFSRVELDRVSFTYPSRTEPSLREVSLRVDHGEVIALVGENGSGKTTLAKLLAGLYQPTAGTIRWDDVDVADVDPAQLREHVAVIFQDFARYFLTAQQNIAIGRPDRIDDRAGVQRAAELAGAHVFLHALPGSYDALLGPSFFGGSDLSIGQWQRIALARAYFRDAQMLILDEPTAALDPRGEYEIFQQVRRLAQGRTVVLISHRFSTVRAADRILVLHAGELVEQGSHEQLLDRGGRYAELFTLQAAGYQPPGTTANHRSG